VSEYKRKRQRKGITAKNNNKEYERKKRRRKNRKKRKKRKRKTEKEKTKMAGEGSAGSGGNRRFLTAVRRLIIKAQRKGKDDSAGKEELDPSAALAEEIRRGPRGRRSQQLEAGMASPVSQNSSPNTGRRKEAATKLGLGRSWGSLDALAPPSTPEHRRYRYPVECNQCMLVQTGEKAHYLGLPCDACGQLPRSPYGMT